MGEIQLERSRQSMRRQQEIAASRVPANGMAQENGDDPLALDRREFLKRTAVGMADALESAARFMGVPGLGSKGPARERAHLDQPEDGAEDPMFAPARRRIVRSDEKGGPDPSVDPDEIT